MAKMAQMIDAATASKPDGLVVSIPDAAALSGPVKDAVAAGIPVIVIDSGGAKLTKELGGLLYLGQSEYEAGVPGRRARRQARRQEGRLHQPGSRQLEPRRPLRRLRQGSRRRRAGAAGRHGPDRDEEPHCSPISTPIPMSSSCSAAASTPPSRRSPRSKNSGLIGKVKLGTFDLSPGILQAVVDGKMEWGIDAQQYLMGYIPVVMFDLMKKYKLMPIADYPTGPGFVTKDEAASVIDLAKQGKR